MRNPLPSSKKRSENMSINRPAQPGMSFPFISIIIPVYNDPEGVNRCLLSLENQSYPKDRFEVIIVDNNSNPPIQISTIYSFKNYIEFCKKPGAYAARNVGIRAAKGEVYAFTDADCTPDKNWLLEGSRALAENAPQGVIGGEVFLLEPPQRTGTALYQFAVGFQQKENIEEKGFTATANLFCSRNQLSSIGEFEENLLSGGDRLWSWRVNQKGFKIIYCEKSIVQTAPRLSLRKAITQARRVTGGRNALKHLNDITVTKKGLAPHRSPIESILWIIKNHNFSTWERAKILTAATLIKAAQIIEFARLKLGLSPERR